MEEIVWAELHAPLFHSSGANLGSKLDPMKKSGLKLEWDSDRKEFWVHYNNRSMFLPGTSVFSMEKGTPVVVEISEKAKNKANAEQHEQRRKAGKLSAQVAGPQHHVFAGPGAGK